jgi:molybdopterin-containing oxidoreductase family iron-sulfur binding subunit
MTSKNHTHQNTDAAALRKHLEHAQGQEYWRSLNQLAETPEFQERLEREFPRGAAEWLDPISRRNFLKLMGASLGLAGVVGCTRQPAEVILPYTNNPERLIPGIPDYYATAMPLSGYAYGLLVESHLGRPTKAEGNPNHPASMGATNTYAQASLLTLYDPERSQTLLRNGMLATWEGFTEAAQGALQEARASFGGSVRILSETVTSPTLASQINTFLGSYPGAVWHQYEPLAPDNVRAGAQMAFGRQVDPRYNLEPANVILSLDADLIGYGPGWVRYANQFAANRRVWETDNEMNRLYVIESTPTTTGANADHRMAVRPSEVEALARLLAQRLGVNVAQAEGYQLNEAQAFWIDGLVSDLQENQGASLVVAGDQQPPAVHALVHAINQTLGNVGTTVTYSEPVPVRPSDGTSTQGDSLRSLVDAMNAGQVSALIILGANPAYAAPVDVDFTSALEQVPFSVHHGLYFDETAVLCTWHVPEAHYLEAWSDARAYDGTASIIQPLIAPLFDGKTAHEVLSVLNGEPNRTSYEIVRGYWQGQRGGGNFEQFWQVSLSNGVVEGTASAPINVTPNITNLPAPQPVGTGVELAFHPDPMVYDGRFANNGWLQELPRPWTRLVWDNAALISPRTAIELFGLNIQYGDPETEGLVGMRVQEADEPVVSDYEELSKTNGRIIEVTYQGHTMSLPVWIVPGHPNNTISLHLGYGRTLGGQVGLGVGFNAYQLRTSTNPWFGEATIVPTTRRYELVSTQDHHSMEGRAIMRAGTLAQYLEEPGFIGALAEVANHPERSLFQDLFPYDGGYSWGMTIDLNSCIGCSVCTIACQAENNIPVVGKDEVAIGREMHWIRIDRYYAGSLDAPAIYQQPMACVHCELAPCEIVCPVNATVHDHEGINTMVYNRCVGTRYCSNNCPYKVRRFNFFWYNDIDSPTVKLLQNPDVTVRSRGVMEKCTYCIQRIQAATINANTEQREVEDGEITPACAQACPTNAITFGNLNDENSRVYHLKQNLLNYGVLEELNFFPRTTYLGQLRNPNPAIGMTVLPDYPGHGVPYGQEHNGSHGEESSGEESGGEGSH